MRRDAGRVSSRPTGSLRRAQRQNLFHRYLVSQRRRHRTPPDLRGFTPPSTPLVRIGLVVADTFTMVGSKPRPTYYVSPLQRRLMQLATIEGALGA